MERGQSFFPQGELQRNRCQSRVKRAGSCMPHWDRVQIWDPWYPSRLHYALTRLTLRPIAACLKDPLLPPYLFSLGTYKGVNPIHLALSNFPLSTFPPSPFPFFPATFSSDLHSLLGALQPPYLLRIQEEQQQPKPGRPNQRRQISMPRNASTSQLQKPRSLYESTNMNSHDAIPPPKLRSLCRP